jgi:hypothetical protein
MRVKSTNGWIGQESKVYFLKKKKKKKYLVILTCSYKRGRVIRTSDLHFIRHGRSQLNYILRTIFFWNSFLTEEFGHADPQHLLFSSLSKLFENDAWCTF